MVCDMSPAFLAAIAVDEVRKVEAKERKLVQGHPPGRAQGR
ncbi:hypothetical protein DFAR_3460030 [Desulfarculales bacterium]